MVGLKENITTAGDVLMDETLTPGAIQDAVIRFLVGNNEAAIFGSQAVNIYVSERRATEDIDVASTRAAELAENIHAHLNERFHIATHVRTIRGGIGFRVYQLRKEGNRHLVDIRPVNELPPTRAVEGALVAEPAEIIANKLMALVARPNSPKAGTDYRDLFHLLHTFPRLQTENSAVRERLVANNAGEAVFELWGEWVQKRIELEDGDGEFDW